MSIVTRRVLRGCTQRRRAATSTASEHSHSKPSAARNSATCVTMRSWFQSLGVDHVGVDQQRRDAGLLERKLRQLGAGLRQAVVGRNQHHRGVDAAALALRSPSTRSSTAAGAAPRSSSRCGWRARAAVCRAARGCIAARRTAGTSTRRTPRRSAPRAHCRSPGRATARRRSTSGASRSLLPTPRLRRRAAATSSRKRLRVRDRPGRAAMPLRDHRVRHLIGDADRAGPRRADHPCRFGDVAFLLVDRFHQPTSLASSKRRPVCASSSAIRSRISSTSRSMRRGS